MDYPSSSRPVESQSNFDYYQGDSQMRAPAVQWTPQDNQNYQNAAMARQNGDVNVYAHNVYIEQSNNVQQYQPVQQWHPSQEAPQRVQYYVNQNCDTMYSNNCYSRRDQGAAFVEGLAGAVIGNVIGNALFGRHRGGYEHYRGGGYEQYRQPQYYPQQQQYYYPQQQQYYYPQQQQQHCYPQQNYYPQQYHSGGGRRHCR